MTLRWGGGQCYSNITELTTGTFGEWRTEQVGVGAACNDALKNYYLEITINGEKQEPRRLLKTFDYLRADANDIIINPHGNITFAILAYNGRFITPKPASDFATYNSRSLMVGGNLNLPLINGGRDVNVSMVQCSKQGFTKIDCDTNLTGADLGVQDDVEVKGSLFTHENVTARQFFGEWNGSVNYYTKTEMNNTFLNLSGSNANQNLNLNPYNLTAASGFFTSLGNAVNKIIILLVQNIEAVSINTTNITAVQYNSVDNGEPKTGLTSSQFRVCKKFKVPDNTCEEWCKLEITGGIITNCK